MANGGFEEGTLDNWIIEGNAFQRAGVVSDEVVEGFVVGKSGEYYFNGLEAGPKAFTGSMKSGNFKIEGTGYVAFLMGAGGNSELCYIGIYDAKTDEELARQSNTEFDGTFVTTHLIRYIVDLSEYMDRTVYIKAVDEDSGDGFAYLILDDFIFYMKDEATLTAFQAERETKLAMLVPPPFEEDETQVNIQNPGFEDGFSGWKILSGTAFNEAVIIDASEKFWDTREYNAVGNKLLNGYNNDESAVGEIRSSKFTLSGDGFISFLIGGSGTPNCFVSIHDGNTDAELIKITNESFKDPEMSLNLSRVYIDASQYIGNVIYIKVTDKAQGGPFGSITLDDFHVSMTQTDVLSLMLDTYNQAMGLGDDEISQYVKDYYMTFQYPFDLPVLRISKRAAGQAIYVSDKVNVMDYIADVTGDSGMQGEVSKGIENITFNDAIISDAFDSVNMSIAGIYTVKYFVEYEGNKVYDSFNICVSEEDNILNPDFESGNLAGWEILTPEKIRENEAVVSDKVFWGEEIPYNSSGMYHFNGWGAGYEEADAYAIRSTAFTLGGSGFISFKMGGRTAAVKVFTTDGSLIAQFDNTEFADVNFPNLDEGCRLATMVTFAADLSMHIGQELYIELHDIGEGPWGMGFFDNIVVRYDLAPTVSEMSDKVLFNKKVDEVMTPTKYAIPWSMAEDSR